MKPRDLFVTRREMLSRCGMGMGLVALTSTLGDTGCLLAAPNSQAINPLAPKQPPLPAKAKRVLHLFMNGGASHVDTFDPKPSLAKFAGKPIPITLKTERRTFSVQVCWGQPVWDLQNQTRNDLFDHPPLPLETCKQAPHPYCRWHQHSGH